MAKNDEHNGASPNSKMADRIGNIIHYASYPLGAVVGLLTGDVSLRSYMYKNFVRRGMFGETKDIIVGEPEGIKKQADQTFQNRVYKKMKSKLDKGGQLSDASLNFMTNYETAHKAEFERLEAKLAKGEEISEFAKTYIEKYKGGHFGTPAVTRPARIINLNLFEGAEKSMPHELSLLVNKKYRNEIRGLFEDIGIKGPLDYVRTVGRNQKIEAAVTAFTFAAVTVGAMLAISDHRELLTHLIPDKDKDSGVAAR